MTFIYHRTIQFRDTDAAGVVYFANVLSMCHEAYEASLSEVGIDLKAFFSNPSAAIPIIHADVDFFKPLFCGDRCLIHLTPKQTTTQHFEIRYEIFHENYPDRLISGAITKHVAIDPSQRTKIDLPVHILQWLERWQ